MEARYWAVLAAGLAGATLMLMLASLLDVPALRLVAVALILAALIAREVEAGGRRLLLTAAILLLVVGVAYLVTRLA